MGKIFGISDLPVTIFTTPLEPFKISEPVILLPRKMSGEPALKHDIFVTKSKSCGHGLLNKIVNGLKIGAK